MRSQLPRQRPMSRRSAVMIQSVSQIFNCSRRMLGHEQDARDGVDGACGSTCRKLGHVGGVPKLVCWWHCEPRRQRSEPYAVLSEPTWLCEAGSSKRGSGSMGLSAWVIVVMEGCRSQLLRSRLGET